MSENHHMTFLDCGFYVGGALNQYLERGEIDEEWDVIVFEPNPELDVQKSLEQFPFKVEWHKKAVWVDNKGVDLWLTLTPRGDASYVDGLGISNYPRKKVPVPSLDFSDLVSKLSGTKIICSMDIEGAEVPVLEKMIKESTIDKVDILDIEFHDRLFYDKNDKRPLERVYHIYREIERRGTEVRLQLPMEEHN